MLRCWPFPDCVEAGESTRLTPIASCGLGFGVRRVFSLVACLLAAIWLPATLHCGLESAGLWHHEHSEDATAVGCAEACDNDACAMLEEGDFKNPSGILKVPAPVFALTVSALHEVVISTQHAFSPPQLEEGRDPPPELTRTWQFAARMALLPGAPSIS